MKIRNLSKSQNQTRSKTKAKAKAGLTKISNDIFLSTYKNFRVLRALKFFGIFMIVLVVSMILMLRIFDYKIGIDLQVKPCIGRLFLYNIKKNLNDNLNYREYVNSTVQKEETISFLHSLNFSNHNEHLKESLTANLEDNLNVKTQTTTNISINETKKFINNRDIIQHEIQHDNYYALKLLKDFFIYSKGTVLIKKIVGMPNDIVTVDRDKVIVCLNKNISVYRRPINHQYSRCVQYKISIPNYIKKFTPSLIELKNDEVFIFGDNEESLDSRFLGPLKLNDFLLYRAKFLF